ncbi:hypothetical protein C8J57DRAFT_1255459 [Mycena rebaudengoi]|nr:hypothetical protein C8J57DRAFT_1255459 [Mycena rebaudengoi]
MNPYDSLEAASELGESIERLADYMAKEQINLKNMFCVGPASRVEYSAAVELSVFSAGGSFNRSSRSESSFKEEDPIVSWNIALHDNRHGCRLALLEGAHRRSSGLRRWCYCVYRWRGGTTNNKAMRRKMQSPQHNSVVKNQKKSYRTRTDNAPRMQATTRTSEKNTCLGSAGSATVALPRQVFFPDEARRPQAQGTHECVRRADAARRQGGCTHGWARQRGVRTMHAEAERLDEGERDAVCRGGAAAADGLGNVSEALPRAT